LRLASEIPCGTSSRSFTLSGFRRATRH
jgi:hypothetical protein